MPNTGEWLAAARRLPIKVLARAGFGVYRSRDLRDVDITIPEVLAQYANRPCIVACPLAHCRWFGPTGLAYGRESLHPYVQSLLQSLRGECRSYQESCLAHYWRSWTPTTLAQSLGLARMLHRVSQKSSDARLGGDKRDLGWSLAVF